MVVKANAAIISRSAYGFAAASRAVRRAIEDARPPSGAVYTMRTSSWNGLGLRDIMASGPNPRASRRLTR